MTQSTVEALATPEEMAEIYKVHPVTMNKWLRAGRIPGAFKVGSYWRIDLEVWRDARRNA